MQSVDYFKYIDNFKKNKHIASLLKYGKRISNPCISIMIPTYKRPMLLGEAISSVLTQQQFRDYEIVVVDNDDSLQYTEEIIELIKSFNDERIVYYCNEQNIGIFGNWNRCIELANGKYMTILGDDDLLMPYYLHNMVRILLSNNDISRVECKYLRDDQRSIKKLSHTVNEVMKRLLVDNCKQSIGWFRLVSQFIHNNFFGRIKKIKLPMYLSGCFTAPHGQIYCTAHARLIGGFNPNFAPIADYVFNASYVYHYPYCYQINEYLCIYRILVNDSLSKKVILGCIKGDKRLTQYILKKNYSFKNKLLRYLNLKSQTSIFKKSKSKIVYSNLLRLYKLFLDLPRR